jgi:hypothetical protein
MTTQATIPAAQLAFLTPRTDLIQLWDQCAEFIRTLNEVGDVFGFDTSEATGAASELMTEVGKLRALYGQAAIA